MNKKGLSVVELIVSFVLCILVFIFIIQVVISVEELYVNLGVKTELLNKQSLISETINNKLLNGNVILIKKCGKDCLSFFYKDNTSERMFINKEDNTFSFGNNSFDFTGLGFVDSLSVTVDDDKSYNQAILTINLNINNSVFESGKYLIKALYQYNINETVYIESTSDKAEIVLLGPAISYKFSEDVFIETGWMVYYPDGRITINSDDVTPSTITFDNEGNGSITYTGSGDASGASKVRGIKNYETAKSRISNLYENTANSNIYLYREMGKYVYKGLNPDNYIVIGTKLFRIISMDSQKGYVLDENGEIVYENGEKKLEDKYLLKVVSEELLQDADSKYTFKFGTAEQPGEVLFNTSSWMEKVCVDPNDSSTCTIHKQNANSIANDIWLQSLLNTGTGRLQIRNAKFNAGIVEYLTYKLGTFSTEAGVYNMKNLYDAEAAERYEGYYSPVLTPKWNGNCLEDICEPNAGILSLTDVLLTSASPDCLEDIVVSIVGGNLSVACSDANWLWKTNPTYTQFRLMTRDNITNTWLLTSTRVLSYNGIGEEYATKGTVFLDANLYILGAGTIDNPYSLYTITR